jgi:TonB family protein
LKATTVKYPAALRKKYIEGIVALEYEVTPAGKAQNARVLYSDPAGVFDKSAIDSIVGWRFLPKVVNGVAVYSARRDVLSFCMRENNPRPADQRNRACRGDEAYKVYVREISEKTLPTHGTELR